jgi:hypothetical protein
MTVAAGVIRDGFVSALQTGIDVSAQRRRAAALDRAESFELLIIEASFVLIEKAIALCAENVGQLHGWPAHFCRGR